MEMLKRIASYFGVAVVMACIFGYLLAAYEDGKEQSEARQQKAVVEKLFQQQKGKILWTGYAGKFDVKITSYSKNGNMYFTGEETLKDITWAKLELSPTIGSMPTLFYMDETNPGQVKKILCSAAEII